MTKILYIPNGQYVEFYNYGCIFEECYTDLDVITWLDLFCSSLTYPNLKEDNNIPKNSKLYLSEFEIIHD